LPFKEIIVGANTLIALANIITFGLGAFKKDWLLTGSAPLKLSALIVCPLAAAVLVVILFKSVVLEWPFWASIALYFVLAFWEGSRPYSYVN
jgi:hypothetical protein